MASKEYDIEIGVMLYDDVTQDATHKFSSSALKYKMPAATDVALEALDPIVRDVQILISDSSTVDTTPETSFNVPGTMKQNFYAGFMTNPFDENVSDLIGFYFEADAPKQAVKLGSSFYQYVTYWKTNDTAAKKTTVGCYSKVGDAFITEIETFIGYNELDDSS